MSLQPITVLKRGGILDNITISLFILIMKVHPVAEAVDTMDIQKQVHMYVHGEI
jgi:hypothetical protein